MKATRIIMGMPVTVEIVDASATNESLEKIFSYFRSVDERFSVYKDTSEISTINKKRIAPDQYSADMKEIFSIAEETKRLSRGYFDIRKPNGLYDPSGIVKGWAIDRAAKMLRADGFQNFYVDAGSDIQVAGKNQDKTAWSIGIRDPFDTTQQGIVKVVYLANQGIATSGSYIRGDHIYNPHDSEHRPITDIVSLTVIGPNVYEADRFATAAYAMGKEGIEFIEGLADFEGYIIDKDGIATMTSGFEQYLNRK